MINMTGKKLFRASTRHEFHLFWFKMAILVFSCLGATKGKLEKGTAMVRPCIWNWRTCQSSVSCILSQSKKVLKSHPDKESSTTRCFAVYGVLIFTSYKAGQGPFEGRFD